MNALIILRSVDNHTIRSLLAAKKIKLLIALCVVFIAWLCDAGRFCALAKAAHEHVSLALGIALTWLNYFGSAVTPMQSGGGPFQVYALYKKGIPVGKGIAITLIRTMLTILILTLAVPIALLLDPEILVGSPFLKGLVSYALVVIVIMWSFVALTLLKPESIRALGRVIIMWLRRFNIMKSNRMVIKIFQWLDKEIDNYILNFRIAFHSGKIWLAVGAVLSVLHLISLFTVLPVLMSAVGLPFRYAQTIAVQAVFMFILYFVPTPGASGVAEGGGALLYSVLMPENMAGVMAITCRFFTDYISIFMGVVVVIRMLGWGVSENLHKGASPESEALRTEKKQDA
ncbi:MAG: flippase-like domain-containing protein [Synergistaceae bacterium]|nr:flippase-like domain-containing protein [Synergistaceae bacterium]